MTQEITVPAGERRLRGLLYHPLSVSAGYLLGQVLKLAFVVALTIFVYRLWFEPRLVTVDLNKIIAAEIEGAGTRAATDAARAANADRFGKALEQALTAATENGRNLILVGPAVVRGGEDRTAAVQAQIRAQLEPRR